MNLQRRRDLVIVRAGDTSLHPTWIDATRPPSFDLVVSYYGRDADRYRDAPFRRIDDEGQKFIGLKRLLLRDAFWRDYDRIWLPDDDLATEQGHIERMFETVEATSLELAQPSLDWHSYYSFGITLQSPSFALRYTDMVEIMAPCFSRAFLERCLPTFDANLSGWGLSFVWPHLLGVGLRRCGILDQVSVTHTRPVGGPSYDRLHAEGRDPAVERAQLLASHGLDAQAAPHVLGAIDRDGRDFDLARPADAGRQLRRIERDMHAFANARPRIEATSLGRRQADRATPALDPGRLREIAQRMHFGT